MSLPQIASPVQCRTSPRSLLLVDDHALIIKGLRALLEPEYVIAGVADDGESVLPFLRGCIPDLVFLDLSLPKRSGMDVLMDISRFYPDLAVVVLTMYVDPVLAKMALRLGARGFVPKNARLAELRVAIEISLAGGRYVSPRIPQSRHGVEVPYPLGFLALTARQQAIIRLLGAGHTTAQIASTLHVSYWTVHAHRKRIRHTLGLTSDWEMTRYAMLVHECDQHCSLSANSGVPMSTPGECCSRVAAEYHPAARFMVRMLELAHCASYLHA